MDEDDFNKLMEAEDRAVAIAGYLALKHANGLSFYKTLELHHEILLRIGGRSPIGA
jgi:hypothetical protein